MTLTSFPITILAFPALCSKRLPHTVQRQTHTHVSIHEFLSVPPTKCTVHTVLTASQYCLFHNPGLPSLPHILRQHACIVLEKRLDLKISLEEFWITKVSIHCKSLGVVIQRQYVLFALVQWL